MASSQAAEASPVQTLADRRRRHLPASAAFGWLAAGWRDLWNHPYPSLVYGVLIFVVSAGVIGGLTWLRMDYILFPALAGFLVVGPLLAVGLYQKSRDIEAGQPVSLQRMLFVKAASGGQIWFAGALLCLVMLLWVRAATIIYALFFGLRPFPGLNDIAAMLFGTPTGLIMLAIGTAVGGLFAAFAFAISCFGIPRLLDEDVDAFTALGSSLVMVTHNLPVMLMWGVIVMILFLIAAATGLVGLIIIFPLLGHATWHSYKAIR